MSISKWPELERPREKLISLGAQSLSEAELLAIFLRTGTKGKNAVEIARELLAQFKSLRNLLHAPQKTLCQTKGLGMAKYVQLQAILEISRRYLYQSIPEKITLDNAKQTKHFLQAALSKHTREVFACLFLDCRHRILAFEEIFYGTIDAASIYPREIIKRIFHHNAAAVIFSHNHPSGDPTPSTSDKKITQKLIEALDVIEVKVLDHIVVGESCAVSFAERGLI